MPALDQAVAIYILKGLAAQSGGYTATTLPLQIYLTMNAPTATVPGTQITGGTYAPANITFGTPAGTSTGAIMYNTGALAWTNGGGSAWVIVGLEIWDSAGPPKRLAYGLFDDQPITVGPGSPFDIAVSAIGWSIP